MRQQLSLYLHIPFCNSKCHYCAFVSEVAGDEKKDEYINCLLKEIELKGKKYNGKYQVGTIYIGGGTPSCLKLGAIKQIMHKIYTNFTVCNDAEITIEINPNSITKEKIQEYLDVNINRFSIGLQAVQPRLLKLIGRTHTAKDFFNCVTILKNFGANNISTDIMIGLPTQTSEDVKETLDFISALNINHISAYMLSVEEGTNFYKLINGGMLVLPKEAEVIKQYKMVVSELKKQGFNRYEVSNFAKTGFRSKHNSIYWQRMPYLGIGVSAHSYEGGYRTSNTSDILTYINYLTNDKIPLSSKDKITNDMAKEEVIMLSMRTSTGINLSEYEAEFNVSLLAEKNDVIKELIKDKFVIIDENNYLKATDKGFMVIDKIISLLAV